MSEKKEDCEPSKPESSEPMSTDEMPAQSGGEVHIDYRQAPARPPAGHKIHPRKKIPAVPEGEERPDKTPSPPVKLD
jgi:hypothetical protein